MNLSLERTRSYYGGNNLESNLSGVAATCYAMVNLNKPNIHDLVMLNVMARGILTDNRNEADVIFDNNTEKPTEQVDVYKEINGVKTLVKTETREKDIPIITAYDTDYFMGNLL
jgi:hypothetical protein